MNIFDSEIKQLKPEKLWRFFYEISQIPRQSKKEQKIIEYLKDFAIQRNLPYKIDKTRNILIKKMATPGYENKETVILQAHVDMVPQKNIDKNHDFDTDPIELIIDNEWIKANETSLGADNGIGVASILTIIDENNIEHGNIEALFTVDEETGLTGASSLEHNFLTGKIFINTDSEEEGEIIIGCAGAVDANVIFTFKKQEPYKNSKAFIITIKNLKGGHSGIDIHLERANANILITRILWRAIYKFNSQIFLINGGNIRNAIPRESEAIIIVKDKYTNEFLKFIKGYGNILKNEYIKEDPDIKIYAEEIEIPPYVMDNDTRNRLISSLYSCPNGVLRKNSELENLVEISSNMGMIQTKDNQVIINFLIRSNNDTEKENMKLRFKNLFEMAHGKISFEADYPGWQPDFNSTILKISKNTYFKLFNKQPKIKVIHAGLECGIIKKKYPELDMVSIGPTIKHPHSPDEKVNIKSVENFWLFLTNLLRNIPEK